MSYSPRQDTRKSFLTGTALGAGGLIGLGIAVPTVAAVFVSSFNRRNGDFVKVFHAPPEDQQERPPDFSALEPFRVSDVEVGKAKPAVINLPGISAAVAPRTIYISVRNLDADYTQEPVNGNVYPSKGGGGGRLIVEGISNNCMHLGCPVNGGAGGFACPCHGGTYDGVGRRKAGPPVRPLDRMDILDGQYVKDGEPGILYAGQLHSVDNDFNRYALTPPGVPVTGLLRPLYPFN